MTNNPTPPDLKPSAIKAARRLQALEIGRVYVVRVVVLKDRLILNVADEGKAEVCGGG